MRLTLTVESGDETGRRIDISAGKPVRLGRRNPVDIVLSGDSLLSNPHAAVEFHGDRWLIRDLGSKFGTSVNGEPVPEAVLADGDEVVMGRTRLRVRIGRDEPSVAEPAQLIVPVVEGSGDSGVPLQPAAPTAPTLTDMLGGFANLHLITESPWREWFWPGDGECADENEVLFEAPSGQALLGFAPWIVRLSRNSPLLHAFVRFSWGRSLGVLFACDAPFDDIRRHLRHMLTLGSAGERPVYFRYYDPRVLRAYLGHCTRDEAREFFGPVRTYLCEDDAPDRLVMFNREVWRGTRVPVRVGDD